MTVITLDMDSGTVAVTITRSANGLVLITAKRGDTVLGQASGEIREINAHLRARLRGRGTDRTHHIGSLLLTPAHVAQIREAIEATPATTPTLSQRRAGLARELQTIRGAIADSRARAHDAGELDAYHGGPGREQEQREQAAANALAAFDRAHPDVVKAVREAKRAARADAARDAV